MAAFCSERAALFVALLGLRASLRRRSFSASSVGLRARSNRARVPRETYRAKRQDEDDVRRRAVPRDVPS